MIEFRTHRTAPPFAAGAAPRTVPSVAALGLAVALGALAGPARADYPPDDPITIVVGWKAGGGTDLVARYIADHVGRETDAEVVVENRPGAGATIAAEEVANAEPDGTTLMFATADSHTLAPLLRTGLGYEMPDSFTPVYLAGTLAFSLVARSDLEPTIEALETASDENDGLTLGTWGVGSTAHIAMEMLAQNTDIELIHVPYQGSAPAINDLQNKQIDLMFLGPGTATQNAADGTMAFVAAASPERIGLAPDYPTFAELGVEGVEMQTWFGLFGPAGLSDEAVSWWEDQMETIMQDDGMLKLMTKSGMDPKGADADGLAAFTTEQSERLGKVIEAAGITVE